jgi:hypothetical protein
MIHPMVKNYARQVVDWYAKKDEDGIFFLGIKTMPELVRCEFAATLIKCERDFASEACGSDNGQIWKDLMVPALIKMLENSTNKDVKDDFAIIFQHGVTCYLQKVMQEIINDVLTESYN